MGTIFLFLPWAFLFKWTGRLLVVVLLGPQNKLIDILWYSNVPTDEQQIYQIFARRMFEARCKQEESNKLKAFRHALFGKYATWVPPLFWTPHQDFPLPESTAVHESLVGESAEPTSTSTEGNATSTAAAKLFDIQDFDSLPLIAGQQLHGKMIPRPEEGWKRNVQESKLKLEAAQASLLAEEAESQQSQDGQKGGGIGFSPQRSRRSSVIEEGFEVTDMFDEEAGFVRDVLTAKREESLYELGVEVLETDGAGGDGDIDEIFLPAWRSIRNLSDEGEGGGTTTSGEDSSTSNLLQRPTPTAPVRMLKRDSTTQQSTIELGLEIAEQIEEEKQFAAQSWQSTSSTMKVDSGVLTDESAVRHDDKTPVTTLISSTSSPKHYESKTGAGDESLPSIPLPKLGTRDRQRPSKFTVQGTNHADTDNVNTEQPWGLPGAAKTDEKKEASSPTDASTAKETKTQPTKGSLLARHETWDSKVDTTTTAGTVQERQSEIDAGPTTALQEDWTLASGGESESSSDDDHRPRVVEGAKSSDGEDFGFEVIEP